MVSAPFHIEWSKKDIRKGNWNELLGENFIELSDYKRVAKRIAEVVIQNHLPAATSSGNTSSSHSDIDVENML